MSRKANEQKKRFLNNKKNLSSGLLEVGNEVSTLLGLLKASENHLSAGNVLLGVVEVLIQSLFVPCDSGVLVGGSVSKALAASGLATEESVERGTLLVNTGGYDVALHALLEDLGSLASVTSGGIRKAARLVATTETKDKMEGRLLLNVVVGESPAIYPFVSYTSHKYSFLVNSTYPRAACRRR